MDPFDLIPDATREALNAAALSAAPSLNRAVLDAVSKASIPPDLLRLSAKAANQAAEAASVALQQSLVVNARQWQVDVSKLANSVVPEAALKAVYANMAGAAVPIARDILSSVATHPSLTEVISNAEVAFESLRQQIHRDIGGEGIEVSDDGWVSNIDRDVEKDEAWANVLVAYGIVFRYVAALFGAAGIVADDARRVANYNTDQRLAAASGLGLLAAPAAPWAPVVAGIAIYLALAACGALAREDFGEQLADDGEPTDGCSA
ncbi:hypothetical protein [Blastococcus sp. Marseille-P5729]|uniref:hypothetical protein n=1 Tax=Blastococcus sp. Marseille-P5729 TaxID=2086582 RepID=UPI000D10B12C|nr:hypothetical protein [Blastococcus sp. Marseille-P5729]